MDRTSTDVLQSEVELQRARSDDSQLLPEVSETNSPTQKATESPSTIDPLIASVSGSPKDSELVEKAWQKMIKNKVEFCRCFVWTAKLKNREIMFHLEFIWFGILIAAELLVLTFMRSSAYCLLVIFVVWLFFYATLAIWCMTKGPLRFLEHFFCVLVDHDGIEYGIEFSRDGVHYFCPGKYFKVRSDWLRPRTKSQYENDETTKLRWHPRTYYPLYVSEDRSKSLLSCDKIWKIVQKYINHEYKAMSTKSQPVHCQSFAMEILYAFGKDYFYASELPSNKPCSMHYILQPQSVGQSIYEFALTRLWAHLFVGVCWIIIFSSSCFISDSCLLEAGPLFMQTVPICHNAQDCTLHFYIFWTWFLWSAFMVFSRLCILYFRPIHMLGEFTERERFFANSIGLFRKNHHLFHYCPEKLETSVKLKATDPSNMCCGRDISDRCFKFWCFVLMAFCQVAVLAFPMICGLSREWSAQMIIGFLAFSFTAFVLPIGVFIRVCMDQNTTVELSLRTAIRCGCLRPDDDWIQDPDSPCNPCIPSLTTLSHVEESPDFPMGAAGMKRQDSSFGAELCTSNLSLPMASV